MNINLEPITEETNIKGNVAYVKVVLEGFNDDDNITFTRNVHNEHNIETIMANVSEEDVFIPTEVKNRRYKEGDAVRLSRFIRGINVHKMKLTRNKVYTLQSRENKSGNFWLYDDAGKLSLFPHVFFELVKSIEEIEAEKPYRVVTAGESTVVEKTSKNAGVNTFFWLIYGEEKAKELAQQCCDFLNAKHGGKND